MTEVAIIMGSSSDWATMKETAKILDDFGLAYEKKVVSAHRTPALMAEFSNQAHEQLSTLTRNGCCSDACSSDWCANQITGFIRS